MKTSSSASATPYTSAASNDWPEIRSRPPSISAVNGLTFATAWIQPLEQA